MKIFDTYLLKIVLPIFLLALLFFVLILQLVDLFGNLNRYLSYEVPLGIIGQIQGLYIPKSLQFALPIALLFSIAYGVGSLHAQNELISVFSSGISLFRFVLPLLLFGILLGIGSFYFEDRVVIPTLRMKDQLSSLSLGFRASDSNTNVTRIDDEGRVIYGAAVYSEISRELSMPSVIIRDNQGVLESRVLADTAYWDPLRELWVFRGVWIYDFEPGGPITTRFFNEYTSPRLNKAPGDFSQTEQNIENLGLFQAEERVQRLIASGLPYRREQTLFYERFSFALTPFVVGLLSVPLGGRFKKNILLLSLLTSLGFAVLYFVVRMLGGLLATLGYLSPILGAWAGVVIFSIGGIFLLAFSRT